MSDRKIYRCRNRRMGRGGSALVTMALSVATIFFWASPASAAVTCEFSGGELRVRLTTDDSSARLTVAGGLILVNGNPCGVPLPATTATTDLIDVKDTSRDGNTGLILDLSGGQFADGGDEIPIKVNLRGGAVDLFAVGGTTASEFWTFGQGGANLQQDEQAEIEFVQPPDLGLAVADEGADRACAGGRRGTGAGAQFSWIITGGKAADTLCGGQATDRVTGGVGPDRVKGLGSGDRLNGNAGNDKLFGSTGGDILRGHTGDDVLDGGPRFDECRGGDGSNTRRRCEAGR